MCKNLTCYFYKKNSKMYCEDCQLALERIIKYNKRKDKEERKKKDEKL